MSDVTQTGIVGFIDHTDLGQIRGRILDHDNLHNPISFTLLIDNCHRLNATANRFGGHAGAEHPPKIGFVVDIPNQFKDTQNHIVEFYTDINSPLLMSLPGTRLASHRWLIGPDPGIIIDDKIIPVEGDAKKAALPAVNVAGSPRGRIIVHMDDFSDNCAVGWSYEEGRLTNPVKLNFYIDDVFILETVSNDRREDVLKSGHPSAFVGFRVPIPGEYHDGKSHRLHLKSVDGVPAVSAVDLQEIVVEFCLEASTVTGHVDGLNGGAIGGWVIRHDHKSGNRVGGQQVLVTYGDKPIAQVTADQFRDDVAAIHRCDPKCGFTFTPPADFVVGRTREFRFWAIPGKHELKGSPYEARFPTVEINGKLAEIMEKTEHIFTQAWALRAEIKALMLKAQYTIENYNIWAATYYQHLQQIQLSNLPTSSGGGNPPLVSIICAAYRPRIKDFVAAVESVIAQTYRNWELIIVDDGSGSGELAGVINAFAIRDRRIRPLLLKSNRGISGATNAALKKAKGQYVAFFDHDDLLVDRAIEFMVDAALERGAKVLYCDEDKIDDEGVLSEVHLKPDWNYRLMLSVNYICHLLFVEREVLRKTGPLRAQCDGAQDHDLILRLAESVPASDIHHVPEILYHWRKTPASTAASNGVKAYAADAGVRAISDHLVRQGLSGKVAALDQGTFYEIEWAVEEEPKVTIIIPYREHIDMTRACVSAIRTVTEYRNYEIVLIDNWSVSVEALDFAREMTQLPGVTVMNVQEEFNFSRLNNLAVERTEGEFVLFMNNDVFVNQRFWLTQLVGEALAGNDVGIVGVKLLYPNGSVQHAGVVLGVGGVADHAHRGLPGADPGYMARAICAQEFSAVTAACMLCRREAFERVGRFDEVDLKVAFNDVDLCMKVAAAGYRIVWTPYVIAEHRESLSRGDDFRPEHQVRFFHENKIMEQRWQGALTADKHYNRHFAFEGGAFKNLRDVDKLGRVARQKADAMLRDLSEPPAGSAALGNR